MLKARFWDEHADTIMNSRQEKVIKKLFQHEPSGFKGGLTAKKYMSMTKCSKATATRDLTNLRDKEILAEMDAVCRTTLF